MVCFTAAAQTGNSTSVIFWTEGRRLQLQDFKVVNDSLDTVEDKVSALTRTGITYYLTTDKVNGRPVSIRITVEATVHKQNTFIKERVLDYNASVKQRLLMHEQKHFDISEIFARQAVRELQVLKLSANYRKEIADFVQAKFKAAEAYQRLYDQETRHGEDFAAQEDWDEAIAAQLDALEAYRKKVVVKKL
ncbi:DUF922 domain-containing protein [Niabella yanshanensis]|uniref:DUF922 domain-containing protein n=1 Tax=Niabella yanshanensis TaxID=577386 RepID=A0ABZ0WAA6_9BACT|nr:DUF922 domain-containing protein [Niabella yanshanensis]WQD40081.1 DUF922 domain-containing protein [Niabella yanshanensis]